MEDAAGDTVGVAIAGAGTGDGEEKGDLYGLGVTAVR